MHRAKFIAIALVVITLSVMTRYVMTNVLGLKTEDTYFTGQLAEASRLEKDLLRVRLDAALLVHGDEHVNIDDVKLALDFVQSRLKTESSAQVDSRVGVFTKYREVLKDFSIDLQAISPVIGQLHPGDNAGLEQVEAAMRQFDDAIADMNRDSYAELYQRSSDLAVQQRNALHRLDQVQWVTLIVGIMAFILLLIELSRSEKLYGELKTREAEIRALASSDPLTGLSNRRHFDDHMRRIDQGLCLDNCHLLMIDLDGFKAVNDCNGHEAGDYVLIETARRLSRAVPNNHLIARVGGDEFGVIVSGSESFAQQAAEAILFHLAEPFLYEGKVLSIGASIGIAMRKPGLNVSSALKREADLALYEAKTRGRNCARLWNGISDPESFPLAAA